MRRTVALALGCMLLLCSCAGMLERDYLVATAHVENPPALGDAAYRVETYPALLSALVSYVEEGMDAGVLRFPTTYEGNLTVDLEKARRQLLEEDPLGAYALRDLTFHTSKIIAYYETELAFDYKVDRQTLPTLPKAADQVELARLLQDAVSRVDETLVVFLTAYPEGEDLFFQQALGMACSALEATEADPSPTPTPEEPEEEIARITGVELYPKTGRRRVAVLELEYPPAEEPAPSPDGEVAP